MEVVPGMTTVRKGSADDPRSLAMRIRNLETQLGMDDETHLIDPNIGVQSSGRWSLFRDTNEDAYSGIDADDQLLALLPVFQFIGTRGQWVGWGTVRCAVSGSGRARMRFYDYIASAFVSECSWSFDFDDAVSDVLVMNGHHSLKSLSGQVRYGLVVDRESGTGTFDVGADDALFSILVVGQTGSAAEPDPGSELFSYTGSAQTFTVPANVFEVTVTAKGAAANDSSGGDGAKGAVMQCSVPVVPGQLLQVNVGGSGSGGTGGWNGGGNAGRSTAGGGGGMSDVRLYPYAITDALVVAGGGGGRGGGVGGYPDGANASGSDANSSAGSGGTSSAGGVAGGVQGGTAATAGSAGQGGTGGNSSSVRYGGGGGGGWYGGGGGGCSIDPGSSYGAGGGSSYAASGSGVVVIASADGGGDAGHGEVLIEW